MLSPTPIDRPNLHPGTGFLITPRVPHGLAAVVEGLTREVLRHRPEDIYIFAAHHFEKLLKLREQYQAEEYNDREFNHEFGRDFNLWPTKETRNIRNFSNDGWSLEKEIEILEGRRKVPTDVEESPEDISTDKENRKASKQTCSRGPSTTKKSSKKETTSDARATRIISQMSALHGPGRSIQTKDIKQELRRNKLSGEKSKTSDGAEKGIRGERRSRAKVPKTDKCPGKEVERATTTTTSSIRTTARRPLKKVRRIETESETETECEATKAGVENGHESSSVKSDGTGRETIARAGSRERIPEARLSEHSSERKVSSRALSMDRIRAYVLRKFASTASLEVLRSPTYVEQVQEVIDRAAPIIKERLEEIRRPRGKRSRSVDLAWNEKSFRQHVRDGKRHDDQEETEEEKNGNGLERKDDITSKEDTESSLGRDETILKVEREEKKPRRRSVGSGKRSRRRENGGHSDIGIIDQVDGNSKQSDKLELESGATRDTLEARLTATQSILEGISKSTSELSGARRIEPTGSEPSESEVSDHVNVVSLPIVRPPSSRNSRSATKNGSDNLTLPPISPEAPKSTKKKDELSLPVLSAVANGNHSAKKSQEQDISKDADEGSTMRDITSDIEDIAILPEDEHEEVIIDAKQDLSSDHQDSISDVRFIDEEKCGKDVDEVFGESISGKFAEKRGSLEEFEELEGRGMEEVYKDSLNVTPEVADVPSRPDSLESNQDEVKFQEDNADPGRGNTFDGLKDKLIEIEMAERSIEKAFASQQVATCDGSEVTSQAEKSMTDGKINEAGKSVNETEETMSEKKLMDVEKISMNKDDDRKRKDDENEERTLTNEIEEVKDVIKISTNKMENLNIEEKLTNKIEKLENKVEESINETEDSTNETETSANKVEELTNESEVEISKNETETSANKVEELTNENEVEILKNEIETLKSGVEKATNQVEISTKTADETINVVEDEKSMNKTESSINEKVPNGVEKLAIKVHVEKLQSMNPRSQGKDNQSVEIIACETGDDNTTTSKEKAENTNEFSKTTAPGNAATESEISITNIPNENSRTKARKKREIDKLSAMTLPSEVPFSYVLSEGSPCEIPDSVTTVIIPDRSCPSPVTLEDEDYQFELMNQKEESLIRSDIVEDEILEKDRHGHDMEVFGEYIRPEAAVLPVDIDFVRGVKGTKPSQDIVIAHQDLDRIGEEGEEEEEKEDAEEGEVEICQEKEDDKQAVVQDEETSKLVGTLEDIVEHEENEEIDARIPGSKDAEEISSPDVPESLPGAELIADAGLTGEEKRGVTIESRGTMENSSEENGSTQDTHTTTSSDVKESTVSNRSVESPSLDRPVVPELNLDSLQDNTVSSFKMTANGTTKEDNGSPRESDATTSLIEPLTSDERLMNRLALADHEEEIVAELLERNLQSEVPEADQLYQAEHAEYEWLERDPLSSETNLEDETKSQEDSIGLQTLPEDALIGSLLREEEEGEDLGSEEEIARELIGSLDEDMQIRAKESDLKEEFKYSGESEKRNLDVDDKSNQSPKSMPLMSIDEQEKREHEVSLEGIDEGVVKIETISELSSQDTNQDNKNGNNTTETEETKSEEKEQVQVAPLAQFEQDELLEQNGKSKTADEKITVENELDIIDANSSDNQEKSEDKQTSIENVPENQNIESMSKIEDSNGMQKENKQEKLQSQEENEQQKLEDHEEHQEKLNDREECEQKKSKAHEECKQEKSENEEKCEEEKLKIQEKDDQEDLERQEEIVDVPSEVIELKKDSTNESMGNDDDERDEIKPTIIRDESVSDDGTEKDVKNKKEEKIRDLSAEIENVHGPITSAISQQSIGDYPNSRYWTMETKSSTMETVIEAFSPNTSTDEKTEERPEDDASEIEGESLIRKKDDFYSAVIKIQACVRGFLARRRMRLNSNSKFLSNNVPPIQKTAKSDHLMVPSHLRETRSGRQRLRREEALRNTTLSLENAFATGRLQHTGEFHDSVPLPLFDLTSSKTSSNSSNESLNKEVEDDIKQANQPDIANSSAKGSDSVRDNEHETSFQKSKAFVDPTFPIVMHLLADASRNCHFTVNQNSHSGFNASAGGVKAMEPTVDILMLGYPRDDENRYLNFITSVEDLGTNMDSLPLDDIMKNSKSTIDAHPSVTSGEGSLREPLALPGTPQGIVIEEVTSLDEAGHVPSESTKSSTAPKTSLDTNSSVSLEVSPPKDEKNDLGTSPKTTEDAMEHVKHVDQEAEKQKFNCSLESVGESDSRSEDANKKSNGISGDSHECVEEKNEKT